MVGQVVQCTAVIFNEWETWHDRVWTGELHTSPIKTDPLHTNNIHCHDKQDTHLISILHWCLQQRREDFSQFEQNQLPILKLFIRILLGYV